MARIRLNQEYRNKIANRLRVHLEQEDTQEKRKYDNLKADQIDINDQAWSVAEKIVRRHYTDDDVEKAYYLQNKFENVSTIAKDSCFHFHYIGTKEKQNYNGETEIEENVPIEKHFDFKLNGSIDTENNYSSNRDLSYSFALFRDEINAQEDPHEKWIESILKQMKEIKIGLKGYKYLDEAIELATELGLSINDAEIIRTNSTGLVIYNPKNLAERIKGMKNTEKTREQKIAERVAYMQQQEINSDNLN
jgi:hypothetical protein